ncbi:tetratricopeptide repeat protein [Halomonas sp. DN3]|uniref:tetratricopeptide repeat protein n=1 Tax=Halomonas sp. DN3 TaxID=2953657 RepID=UPI0020A21597|nr:tetratricopeptide repeat protein [Halomonas sp. DN3]USZ50669.1 sel1 repeat family protein [Halomonas sp. DN3]
MRNFLKVLVSCLLFLISGCYDEENLVSERFFVSMEGEPVIFNTVGDELFLIRHYENRNFDCFRNSVEERTLFCEYYTGVAYFGRMTGVNVDADPDLGRNKLVRAWKRGAVDAGFELYTIFLNGVGVKKNKEVAMLYLVSSADLGFLRSERKLGHLYSGSDPENLVDDDFYEAHLWFSRSAEQGDKLSAVNLAWLYYEGLGVKQSDEKAFEWLLAAERLPHGDELDGFSGLAKAYEEGIGTDIDLVQAYKYYDLLSPGSAPDKARIEEKMTPEQIHKAIRLSRLWQEEHNIFVSSYYGLEYQEDGTFQ